MCPLCLKGAVSAARCGSQDCGNRFPLLSPPWVMAWILPTQSRDQGPGRMREGVEGCGGSRGRTHLTPQFPPACLFLWVQSSDPRLFLLCGLSWYSEMGSVCF